MTQHSVASKSVVWMQSPLVNKTICVHGNAVIETAGSSSVNVLKWDGDRISIFTREARVKKDPRCDDRINTMRRAHMHTNDRNR